MNREQVKELFQLLVYTYPRFEVSTQKIDTWTRLMQGQDANKVMKRAENYVKDNKFPPSFAELYEKKIEAHSSDFLEKVEKWKQDATGKPRD